MLTRRSRMRAAVLSSVLSGNLPRNRRVNGIQRPLCHLSGRTGIGHDQPATIDERGQSLHNLLDTHSRAQLVASLHLIYYRP